MPYVLEGEVTIGGEPAEEAKVYIIDADADQVEDILVTDADGTFRNEYAEDRNFHAIPLYEDIIGDLYSDPMKANVLMEFVEDTETTTT